MAEAAVAEQKTPPAAEAKPKKRGPAAGEIPLTGAQRAATVIIGLHVLVER